MRPAVKSVEATWPPGGRTSAAPPGFRDAQSAWAPQADSATARFDVVQAFRPVGTADLRSAATRAASRGRRTSAGCENRPPGRNPLRGPVRQLPIDGRHLLQRELVHVVPVGAKPHLMQPQWTFARDAPRLVGRCLFCRIIETDRRR